MKLEVLRRLRRRRVVPLRVDFTLPAPKELKITFSMGAICWKVPMNRCILLIVPMMPSIPPIRSTKPWI